ncbi:MAG TPA: hypothetical protein VFF08_01215 [Trueperaceae bacterium]|nr:hypothetical protein [Trueperaceae bacterium]
MYTGLLDLHNVVRWVVVVLGVVSVVSALVAQRWTPAQNSLARWFTIAVDVQVLLGLVLWFVSPLVRSALGNMGAVMSDPAQRKIVIEHPVMMVVAAALVHVGASRGRKTDNPRQALVFYLLAALAIAYAIPWDRRLLPGL